MEEKRKNFQKKVENENHDSSTNLITRNKTKSIHMKSRKTIQKKLNSNSSFEKINKKEKEKKEKISSNNEGDNSLLIMEEVELEKKKKMPLKKSKKEKRYIVDNMEDILSKISKEKLKLDVQEYILYFIVFMVCVYHWIFLFLSRPKLDFNFCFMNNQFDSCSQEQICKNYNSKMNLIIFNNSLSFRDKSYNELNAFNEANKIINEYYKPSFISYYAKLTNLTAFRKFQYSLLVSEKINFCIVIATKERWNLFYANYVLCETDNFFNFFIAMVALGGVIGSLIFGFLSDIFGRRSVIRSTLFIITLMTFLFAFMSFFIDKFRTSKIHDFEDIVNEEKGAFDSSFINIMKEVYMQYEVKNFFEKYFFVFCLIIFLISGGLWPLLKSCMALLIENAKSELDVLIGFRRYNFFFGGLPAFCTSLIYANINNFTLTFLILGIITFILFIFSVFFLEESIRYYYEYCEWEKLTEVVLNIYKVNIEDFKTLNDEELKKFRKEENIKNFNNSIQNSNYYISVGNDNNDKNLVFQNSYYKLFKDKNIALKRNIKRDTDFIIKLEDVRSNPFIIITCLFSNRTFNNSKMQILVILILLYVTMNLLQKEFLETPYFTLKDLYFGFKDNFLINSTFFFLLIANALSNFFFYGLYRINCFKTVIMISLVYNTLALLLYYFMENLGHEDPINFNRYSPKMISKFNRDNISFYLAIILFTIYFLLNGVNFYVYLLILKVSKTIYRCTYFSIHSISLIAAFVITEFIHILMDNYFLFLSSLNALCLIVFIFLSEFKELLYVVNDLKIDIHRPSKNIYSRQKND